MRLAWLAAIVLVPCASFEALAQSGRRTIISLEFTTVSDRLSPPAQQGVTATSRQQVVLSGGNRIETRGTSQGPARLRRGDVLREQGFTFSSVQTLGQQGGRSAWRVGGPNRLVRVVNFPNNTATHTITVRGTQCSLSIVHQLRPGQRVYTLQSIREGGRIAEYANVRTARTSCTIRQE